MIVRKKILVVDDEITFNDNLSQYLRDSEENYKAFSAYNAEEALEVLKNNKIDLVITDVRMPRLSGLELIGSIRKDFPQMPVIVMTGYRLSRNQKLALEVGVINYLEKPFRMSKLLALIKQSLQVKPAGLRDTKQMEKMSGFSGQIKGLNLTDIIQMNCISQASNKMIIKAGDNQAEIYFQKGEIVHSSYRNLKGEEAFYKILKFTEGEFFIEENISLPEKSINKAWEYLMLEGLKRKDEKEKHSQDRK